MVEQYQKKPDLDTVEHLAKLLSKSKKSIIGKLSKEGVYRRQVYKTKAGEDPITKADLVADIVNELDIDPESLRGLDKAPKAALVTLRDLICK